MRTTLDLPEDLLNEAMRATSTQTKTKVIITALEELIEFQYKCLKNGLKGIGIPYLIIAQNAKQNHCEIYSLDSHFKLIKDIVKIKLTA